MNAELAQKYAKKWRDDSPEYPPCAECREPVGSAVEDEEAVMVGEGPEVAIRVFRKHPDAARAAKGDKQELAFHRSCAYRVGLIQASKE